MNVKKKIAYAVIMEALQKRMNYKHPAWAFKTLITGWIAARNMPHTCETLGWTPPSGAAITARMARDGYRWLTQHELHSFEKYIGYSLDIK